MQSVMLEVMCLGVIGMMLFFGHTNNRIDYSSSMYIFFRRIVYADMVAIVLELIASYSMSYLEEMSLTTNVVLLELYFNSLFAAIVFCSSYVIRLVNTELPQLKKIGKWIYYFIGSIIAIMEIIPIMTMKVVDGQIYFSDYVFVVYGMLIFIEIFVFSICVRYRKHLNRKTFLILSIGYALQLLTIIIQAVNPHVFMMSIALVLVTISHFMTLESTDVKLLEELENEKQYADEANKAKSEFIANVSHEIRTPINAVLGLDEMILRESRDEKIRHYARDIKSAAQTLHSLINEILDMSKMESGKMEILPVNYNMRSLVNDTINVIQLKMDEKQLQFNVNVDPSIPAGYNGDEVRVKQVLSNILSNAVKYTNEGSVTMTITGEKLLAKRELLHVRIEDTGIGMTRENLNDLFEEFRRFDNEKNRNVEGTGLGMSITMKLLKLMGTELNVSSVYGEGTTFYFDLEQGIWDETPLGDFRKESYSTTVQYTYEKSFEAPETKVLVVDDNAINRKVFIGLLKDTKLSIDEAESGPECLNMCRKNKYDLIFMDHMMPDMDGIETFRQLKVMEDNLSRRAKVIMLTANAISGARENYLEEGFDDFMAKPIVPDKLEEMIRKYL